MMSSPPAEEIVNMNGTRPSNGPDGTDSAVHSPMPPSNRGGSHPTVATNFDSEWLDLSASVIEDNEVKILARALEDGRLTKLKSLYLEGNAGDIGARATLNALRKGHLRGLEELFLLSVSSYDQITTAEEGTEAIADSLFARGLSNLITMDLTGTLPKLIPARSWTDAVKDVLTRRSFGKGRLRESVLAILGLFVWHPNGDARHILECLRCQVRAVYSGDDGITKIGRALKKCPIQSLKVLTLQANCISDEGASDLAKILCKGVLPRLEELDLRNNLVGKRGAENIVRSYLQNPLLMATVKLDWPDSLLEVMATAFRENNIRLQCGLESWGIRRDRLVINKFKCPEYFLRGAQRGRCLGKGNHRLGLMCQADCSKDRTFEAHQVQRGPGDGDGDGDGNGDGELDGIELRVRSLFFNKTKTSMNRRTKNYMDREVDPNSGDFPVADRPPSSDQQTPQTPRASRREWPERILKRTRGVQVFVMDSTCGFVGAAKDLGNQTGRAPGRRSESYRRIQTLFQSKAKTEQIMKIIKYELLMLAERKPDEFFHMFGLRQVLLKNPEADGNYSRVWICRACYSDYCSRDNRSVVAITTDDELNPPWARECRARPKRTGKSSD